MYWLIVERESFRTNAYTIPDADTLPVFSHEREAQTFLRLEGLVGGWQTRETSEGELISLLLGLCARVRKVALDPTAETGPNPPSDLVNVQSRTFVDFLMRHSRTGAGEVGAGR